MTRAFDQWLTPQQIEQKVIDLVSDVRNRFDLPDGCPASDVCQQIGLAWRRRPLAPGMDGLWTGRIVIVNEAIRWPARVEFTIFHELMHYLLDDDGELIEYFTDTLHSDPSAYQRAIERCCNQGAAEFLMPRTNVRRLIEQHGISVQLIAELANGSGASLVAAAAQMAFCSPRDCFVCICVRRARPQEVRTEHIWEIEYAFAPLKGKYILRRYAPIPADHLILDAFHQPHVVRGRSFVPFPTGTRMPCTCEVMRVGSRLVAILGLESSVPQNQLGLLPL